MKKIMLFISLLLICTLLFFSSIPLICGNFVSATTGAANLLPNYFVNGLDTPWEDYLSDQVANYIGTIFFDHYITNFDFRDATSSTLIHLKHWIQFSQFNPSIRSSELPIYATAL